MTAAPSPSTGAGLPARYAPRAVRGLGVHSVGGWRVKLYGLYAAGDVANPAALEGALLTARRVLPLPAVGAGRSGTGFVIAHHAVEAFWYVVGWWSMEGILMMTAHRALLADPTRPVPCPPTMAGCVWELGVVDHERRAWIEAMMRDDGIPDVEAYLGRFAGGTV